MATKLENLTTKLQSALDLANALPDAITLDELTNPGSAATMLEGTEMLDADGKKVTGTIENKDSSDLTATLATVTVPAGYYASQATKSVQDLEWDNMYHDVNPSTGVVEFSQNTVSGGYVQPRTDITSSLQLPTQPATTITPTKSSQTAVAAGKYTTGAVTVEAIPDEYIDTSDANAQAAHILEGETAYVDGVKVTGTMPDHSDIPHEYISVGITSMGGLMQPTLDVSITDPVAGAGYYPSGSIYSATLADTSVTPSKSEQVIIPNDGELPYGKVNVLPIPDEYQDVSNVTATAARTAKGDVFVDADGVEQTGTLNVNKAFLLDSGDYAHAITGGYVATTSSGDHALHFVGDVFGNAARDAVLEGRNFTAYAGVNLSGTMPNNGSVSTTIDGLETQSVTVPEGYTTGGTVALDSTIDDTADSQAAQIAEIMELLEGKSVSGGGSAVETCAVTMGFTGSKCTRYVLYQQVLEDGSVQATNGSVTIGMTGGSLSFIVKKGSFVVYHNNGETLKSSLASSLVNAEQVLSTTSVQVFEIGQSDTAEIYCFT